MQTKTGVSDQLANHHLHSLLDLKAGLRGEGIDEPTIFAALQQQKDMIIAKKRWHSPWHDLPGELSCATKHNLSLTPMLASILVAKAASRFCTSFYLVW